MISHLNAQNTFPWSHLGRSQQCFTLMHNCNEIWLHQDIVCWLNASIHLVTQWFFSSVKYKIKRVKTICLIRVWEQRWKSSSCCAGAFSSIYSPGLLTWLKCWPLGTCLCHLAILKVCGAFKKISYPTTNMCLRIISATSDAEQDMTHHTVSSLFILFSVCETLSAP